MQLFLRYLIAAFSIVLAMAAAVANAKDSTSATSPTTVATTPSLRLHVILKPKKMHIHGQSVFDVFAKPVVSADGASVRYDGFATFIQGETEFTYLLVDGAAYVVEATGVDDNSAATRTAKCLTSVTPFDSIVSALNNLTAISSESVGKDSEVDCSSETAFETSFGGEAFVVCASGSSGFIAYGGGITMAVEYLERPLRSISAPKLSDGSASCPVVAAPTVVAPTTLALLTGDATCASLENCLA
jgi:hypothetical protein